MINPNVKTLADLPFHIAGRFPERAILRHSVGNAFIDLSGHDFLERVRDLSLGLGELGVAAGDRVAVVAESRPEWCITDLAVLTAGGVTVPVYPTLTSGQVRYILNDCAATDRLRTLPGSCGFGERHARRRAVIEKLYEEDGRPIEAHDRGDR